jgi:hypothetical protein
MAAATPPLLFDGPQVSLCVREQPAFIVMFDLREVSYEDFERFVFDHPPPAVGAGMVDWYWDALDTAMASKDYRDPQCEPARQVAHLTTLLQCASKLPKRYTPTQLEQGFWLLFGPAGEELFQQPLFDGELPWVARATCLSALIDLYEGLFAWEPCGESAYMLFDGLICSRYGYPHPTRYLNGEDVRTRAHLFGILQRILALPSTPCQRGALHGLGHLMHPGTAAVIERFLHEGKAADESIVVYANAAKIGDIQ